MRIIVTETERAILTLGGVPLIKGTYLLSGEDEPSSQKPGKGAGYAFFDGKTLTLHGYEYFGGGLLSGEDSIGLLIPAGELTICMEGESAITVDAVARGVGLWAAKGASVVIKGKKGSLTINARNGKNGNLGVGGDGSVTIKSGTLRAGADPAAYTVEKGKKRYAGESYAVNIAEFIDRGAHVTGNDKRGNKVNKNSAAQVTYDFHRKILWLPLCLILVALLALGVTFWALFLRTPEIIAPDYAPVDKEQYAESIPDETAEEKMDVPEGGGGIGVTYSIEVSIDRATGLATLYFANPSRSPQDMVLQLIVKDELLAESGTLNPGDQVTQLALQKGAADKLAAGGYDGIVRVLAYRQDTGEKSITNTDIKVNVTVQ